MICHSGSDCWEPARSPWQRCADRFPRCEARAGTSDETRSNTSPRSPDAIVDDRSAFGRHAPGPSRGDRRPPLVLPHVPRGVQLAALLSLAAAEPQLSWDAGSIAAVLSWEPRVRIAGYREAVFSVVSLASVVLLIGISLRGNTPSVSYPVDDAIYPGGVKRDRASIEQFMTSDGLPLSIIHISEPTRQEAI